MSIEDYKNPMENKDIGLDQATSFEEMYKLLKMLGDISLGADRKE